MGGRRYSDNKRFVQFLDKGNSDNFYKLIRLLNFKFMNWLKQVIKHQTLLRKEQKQLSSLILPVFIIKKSNSKKLKQKCLIFIENSSPNIASDYNLIEWVWHSTKEYIVNRLFKSIEDLEYLLHRLLNEGELIIKWERKITNKGNACKLLRSQIV